MKMTATHILEKLLLQTFVCALLSSPILSQSSNRQCVEKDANLVRFHPLLLTPNVSDTSIKVFSNNYTKSDSILQHKKFELGVKLPKKLNKKIHSFLSNSQSKNGVNPFMEEEIKVYAQFSQDSLFSNIITIDGFFTQNYTPWTVPMEDIPDVPKGESCNDECYKTYGGYKKTDTPFPFLIRFSPPNNGTYFARIFIEERGEIKHKSSRIEFSVVKSKNKGFVKVAKNNRFLALADSVIYPSGINIPWPETDNLDYQFSKKITLWYADRKEQTLVSEGYRTTLYHAVPRVYRKYRELVKYWNDNGVNLIRTIMAPPTWEIEFEELGNYSKRLPVAQEMDAFFELCEANDILVDFNLSIHYNFERLEEGYWRSHAWRMDRPKREHEFCYKKLCEGVYPENPPIGFFISEEAKKYYKQRLRYILSRWGYSSSIAFFELMSEINSVGFNDENNTAFYDKEENYKIILAWQEEMAAYIKSHYYGREHLLTTSYAGLKHPSDSIFDSEDMDIMTTNVYDMGRPRFNSFFILDVTRIILSDADHNYYMRNNIKPFILSETQPGGVMGYCETREKATNDCDVIELNRYMWQSLFSGIAGGFNWSGRLFKNNTEVYGQISAFLNQKDFNSADWIPGSCEQVDDEWHFKKSWIKHMVGKNNRADLSFLRSEDGEMAVGVLTNRTYNVQTSGSCDLTGTPVELKDAFVAPEAFDVGREALKLRGMKAGKYHIDYYLPSDLSTPFASSENWGPKVRLECSTKGTEKDYIVLFRARKK